MRNLTRRSTICTLGLILISGCTRFAGRSSNEVTIADTHPSNRTKVDGTLSAYGYVKFIEQPSQQRLIIQQTFVDTSSSCKSSEVNVTPNSGDTNGDPITVRIKPQENKIQNRCVGSNNQIISPSGVIIEFKSLDPGQEVIFEYDNITVSYTTTGEQNTAAREPIAVPEDVRTNIG